MGHALDRVGLAVGEVVGRVDAPFVAGPGVSGVDDPVQDRIAEVEVRAGHVDLRPEDAGPVRELAGPHPGEQVEVVGDGTVPPGRRAAGLRQRPARLADLLGGRVVDEGQAVLDQVDRPFVQLLEVVGRVVAVVAPVEPEPAHVLDDRVDVLLLLLDRVRVVEPEVAAAAEFVGDPEVQADGLRVPDVEVAVGLGREPGDGCRDATGGDVRGDDLADEVAPLRRPSGLLGVVGGPAVSALIGGLVGHGRGSCNAAGRSRHVAHDGRATLAREVAGAPGFEPGTP